MVNKLEATAKAVEPAGLEKGDKGDKNPSLNLVDLKSDQPTKTPDTTAGKSQTDSAAKSLPSFEIVGSQPANDSPKQAENRASFNKKEPPRYEGIGVWAPFDGYTLPNDTSGSSPKKSGK